MIHERCRWLLLPNCVAVNKQSYKTLSYFSSDAILFIIICSSHSSLRVMQSYPSIPFSELQQEIIKEADQGAPPHRILRRGINFEGTCKNQECSLYNRRVWINAGYGTFNMSKVVIRTKCPKCNEWVEELNIMCLFMGRMVIQGQHTVNKIPVESEKKFIHRERGTYLSFKKTINKIVQWVYLEITVSKLDEEQYPLTPQRLDMLIGVAYD